MAVAVRLGRRDEDLLRLRLGGGPVERLPRVAAGLADDVARAPKDRARRGAAHEQGASEQQRAADDRRAGLADEAGQRPAESEPDVAARVAAEQRHEPEEAHTEAEPERPHVEQVAPREEQSPHAEERDREHERGATEDGVERVGEPGAHRASVEVEIEDRAQDEPERAEAEPEELALVLRLDPTRRPLLDPRGDAWPKRPLLPPAARHAGAIRRLWARSCAVRRSRARGLLRRRCSASARFP